MGRKNDAEKIQTIDDDQLEAALDHLGVEFIAGNNVDIIYDISPSNLLAGLANSDDARMRMALIPLFLLHPEFSEHVKKAMKNVNRENMHYLECYYLAAYLIQKNTISKLKFYLAKKSGFLICLKES